MEGFTLREWWVRPELWEGEVAQRGGCTQGGGRKLHHTVGLSWGCGSDWGQEGPAGEMEKSSLSSRQKASNGPALPVQMTATGL